MVGGRKSGRGAGAGGREPPINDYVRLRGQIGNATKHTGSHSQKCPKSMSDAHTGLLSESQRKDGALPLQTAIRHRTRSPNSGQLLTDPGAKDGGDSHTSVQSRAMERNLISEAPKRKKGFPAWAPCLVGRELVDEGGEVGVEVQTLSDSTRGKGDCEENGKEGRIVSLTGGVWDAETID